MIQHFCPEPQTKFGRTVMPLIDGLRNPGLAFLIWNCTLDGHNLAYHMINTILYLKSDNIW